MRLLPLKVRESFMVEIRKGMARRRPATNNLSEFVREAIIEKLQSLGIKVPEELALALDRTGKGGRPRGLYDEHRRHVAELNEAANSTPDAAATIAAKKAAEDVAKGGVKYGRKRKAGGSSGQTSSPS